jgi:hypothetical protein
MLVEDDEVRHLGDSEKRFGNLVNAILRIALFDAMISRPIFEGAGTGPP